MDQTAALKFIVNIIRKQIPDKGYKIFLFGSRVMGTARRYSDIDIGILGEKSVPVNKLESIEEILENSDLPYNVDVVDFAKAGKSFTDLALNTIKYL